MPAPPYAGNSALMIKKNCNTGKPVEDLCIPRYGSFMETLNLRPFNLRHEGPTIQIAPAHDCDGSLCHQPIFREDGTLNYVAPHCHLVEQRPGGARYYAVFCDFPSDARRAECGPQSVREFRQVDSILANYPPFPEEAARRPVSWTGG
jgi:hypothetical protein